MMNKQKILSEGRYDSFVREIVQDIMYHIKESEGEKDVVVDFTLPYDNQNGEEYYTHESGVEIGLDLRILRTDDTVTYGNREVPFNVNSYVANDDYLVVEIVIDDTYGREHYEQMFYKINEDVRHEVEHYLQDILPDRQQPNIPNTADYETTFAHHMDPSEVEALVHGFYRRAKLEKKTLDEVMLEDIHKDIQDGNLTPDEGDKLLNTWVGYAIKNLPQAQYSNSFRRKFIIQK